MDWRDYFDRDLGIFDYARWFADGGTNDMLPDTLRDNEDNPQRPDPNKVQTTTVDDGTTGGNTWPGNPDVLPEDRQAWLDFISPANQTFSQFLQGINTPAEDAITSGTMAMSNKLSEQMALQGRQGGDFHTAMQGVIERGATGMEAQSRLNTMMAGLQGKTQLAGMYGNLLHQQGPTAKFSGAWKGEPTYGYDKDGNPIWSKSTPPPDFSNIFPEGYS